MEELQKEICDMILETSSVNVLEYLLEIVKDAINE